MLESAGQWDFIGQSFSYSLLKSRFRLTLISSATHVGLWATSPQTSMCVQNTLSLLILDPHTMDVFEANGHLTHQWRLDIFFFVYSTKTNKQTKKDCFLPEKLYDLLIVSDWD